jgi:hypothetical protein
VSSEEAANVGVWEKLTGAEAWEKPRALLGARLLRTTIRTVHLVTMGILYGGHVYGISADRLLPALAGTLASGAAFVTLEAYRTPLWLVQMRGLLTLMKILIVASCAVWWDVRVWLLTLALVIGSVGSHMPGKYRYYSVMHGRAIGEQESG